METFIGTIIKWSRKRNVMISCGIPIFRKTVMLWSSQEYRVSDKVCSNSQTTRHVGASLRNTNMASPYKKKKEPCRPKSWRGCLYINHQYYQSNVLLQNEQLHRATNL